MAFHPILMGTSSHLFITGASSVLVLCFVALIRLLRLRERRRAPVTAEAGTSGYSLQFPPSRRHALSQVLQQAGGKGPWVPLLNEKGHQDAEIPPAVLKTRALPTTRAVPPTADGYFTPTGFSAEEIRALGRFPDYSVLSGVPHPEPCSPEFDISRAEFRPFRPFRWAYHQTMAHMKMEPDYWLDLEKNYHTTMAARQSLIQTHRDRILFSDPGSELPCRELMEMILQFLCIRYPAYFRLESGNTILINTLLSTKTNLTTTPPLDVLAANVPEDYAIMLRNEHDGLYYLRAALVCSSVGWDIAEKRGKPMQAIHEPVPDYAAKMAFSVDRFFSRLATDQPIQRCSWSLEDCAPLFSSPHAEPGWNRSAFAAADYGKVGVGDVKLRCDWQTLRRLPLSGAIAFNFKAVFTPLETLRDEPYVPTLLATVLREGKRNLIEYKAMEHVIGVALRALDGWAAEQVAAGTVPEGWEVRTLDEHPYYPGWRERWRAAQGF